MTTDTIHIQGARYFFELILCVLFCATSCNRKHFDSDCRNMFDKKMSETKAVDTAFSIQTDPFALTNVQMVYDRICSVCTESTFYYKGKKLDASHRAIKVFPNNVSEQRRLEFDPALKVGYGPFENNGVPSESTSRSVAAYSSTSLESKSCVIEEIIRDSEPLLPIYVIWPCEKEIPDTLNYEVLYDILLPSADGISRAMSDDEMLLFDTLLNHDIKSRPYYGQTGYIYFYDEFLSANVTVSKLKLRIQIGSSIQDIEATNGVFQLPGWYPSNASIGYYLQQDKFTVSTGDVTGISPQNTVLGTISDLWDMSTPYSIHTFSISPDDPTRCYRAADFFVKTAHEQSPLFDIPDHITIQSWHFPNDSLLGCYRPPSLIQLFHSSDASNLFIGTVMHEYGHAVQYKENGNSSSNIERLLKESFASFMGWHYGELYYSSKGYVQPNLWTHVNRQHRQAWRGINKSPYSPLFVDLKDSFNQHSKNPYFLTEELMYLRDF